MTPRHVLRRTFTGVLAILLTGCAALSPAPGSRPGPDGGAVPADGPETPVPQATDPEGPAGGTSPGGDGPAAGGDGPADAGSSPATPAGTEAEGRDGAGEELTMLDCLRRFGLAELGTAVEQLVQGLPDDERWRCVARTARFDPTYRAWVAYELLISGLERIDTALPGYQAFARTTELHFEDTRTVPAPEGWALLDALPSPSGRYVAARLADGGVGWWAVDGSGQERYDVDGYDLIWHPEEDQLAFLSDGTRLHLVRPAGPVVHQVFEAPAGAPVRFPYWALQEWWPAGSDRAYPPGTVMVLADPEGEPEGLALRPDAGRWERFPAMQIFAPGREVVFPAWLTQPWNARSGDYLHVDPEWAWVAHPNRGGSPYQLYRVPEDAEPVFLTWSPEARFLAVVERRNGQLTAQVVRASGDYRGEHVSLPLENGHFAIWDDGVTTFTAAGRTVAAKNHLTGAERTWQVEGDVRSIRLGRHELWVVLAERVVVVPFAELAAVSAAPGAEHKADAAQK